LLAFSFDAHTSPVNRVLVLGAHSDDIEIGAGGTLRRLLGAYPAVRAHWVVFSARERRAQEARESAAEILGGDPRHTIETHEFRDGFFPYRGERLKEAFEALKAGGRPDIVLTHHREDLHQDHRLVAELTWNTFRDHVILEYEVPKYDGVVGAPNFFVPLSSAALEAKIEGLMRHFGSQRDKQWFTPETFRSLARLRGIECRAPTGYAEAFYLRKAIWGPALSGS
jgi:LmbE family N-acetylglucosaminyl deacetylase